MLFQIFFLIFSSIVISSSLFFSRFQLILKFSTAFFCIVSSRDFLNCSSSALTEIFYFLECLFSFFSINRHFSSSMTLLSFFSVDVFLPIASQILFSQEPFFKFIYDYLLFQNLSLLFTNFSLPFFFFLPLSSTFQNLILLLMFYLFFQS